MGFGIDLILGMGEFGCLILFMSSLVSYFLSIGITGLFVRLHFCEDVEGQNSKERKIICLVGGFWED